MARVLGLEHHLLRQHLRVGEHVLEVHDPAAGHAGPVQTLDPCRDRRLADLGVDDRPQALAMGEPGGVGRKVRVLQQIGEAELLEQALDDRGRAGRDRDVAVPGVEQAVGVDHRMVVAGALRQLAGRSTEAEK